MPLPRRTVGPPARWPPHHGRGRSPPRTPSPTRPRRANPPAGHRPERRDFPDTPAGRPARTEMTDEALAARPDQHRDTGRDELRERGEKLEVVADRSCRTRSRGRCRPPRRRRHVLRRRISPGTPHLSDNVVVTRIELHVRRSSLCGASRQSRHRARRQPPPGSTRRRSAESPPRQSGVRDRCLGRVDRHADLSGECLDHGHDPA